MRIILAALLLVTLAVGVALADEVGVTNADGFTLYKDGYYYVGDGTQAFTKVLRTTPGTLRYGVYYPGTSYYAYVPYVYPKAAAAKQVVVTPAEPEWRSRLLAIAAQRDKAEAKLRASAFEHAYFLESVKTLGLEGNFRWQNYGTAPPMPSVVYPGQTMPYASPGYSLSGSGYQIQNFGANATTSYGYSSLASLYGDTNLGLLYQQAASLAQQSQKLGGDATAGFQQLVGAEGVNRARVAEILAKGQVAAQVLASIQAAPVTVTRGYTWKVEPAAGTVTVDSSKADDATKKANLEAFQTLVGNKCASCHAGNKIRGGLDISKYLSFTQAQKENVWRRINSTDPTKVMPRDEQDESKAGPALTQAEKTLFYIH